MTVLDYPARVKIVVDEDQGQNQLGLLWGIRSENYSSASTAKLTYEAEALGLMDTAAKAALAGASGGTVVTHGTLSTNWTPIVNTNVGGTAYLTHTGTYRLWGRVRTTSGTAVQVRSVYDIGDMTDPVENAPWRTRAGTAFFIADFGELRLDAGPVGTHRWQSVVQAKGDVGGENVSLDKLWFQPVDDGRGVLTAPINPAQGLAAYSARDEFNQSPAALTGLSAPVGGKWTLNAGGDTNDFAVVTGNRVARTAVSDTGSDILSGWGQAGRMVYLPISLGLTAAAVTLSLSATPPNSSWSGGMCLRRAGATSGLLIGLKKVIGGLEPVAIKCVSNTASDLVGVGSEDIPGFTWDDLIDPGGLRLTALVDTDGRVGVWIGRPGSRQTLIFASADADLATGGPLASGATGIFDDYPVATALTRQYDNFAVWVPARDAVAFASQSLELTTQGMVREDSAGVAYGPVSQVIGDLPRLPPAGIEGRTTEVFLKASRGDFGQLPDNGIDDISAKISYRPCWLTVPGS